MIGLEARDARKWKAAEDVLKNYETDVMGRQEAERKCVEHAKHAEEHLAAARSSCRRPA